MKMKSILGGAVMSAALLFGLTLAAGEPTAFALVKEGNRHVGEEARDKVVQIRSEKSLGTLTPNIWYVVYFDPDATAKATEVKFGAGKKLSVKRPARILEGITGAHQPLAREKLKIDSDRALEVATKEPLLNNLKLLASQLKLERNRDDDQPVWRVRLWAAKLRQTGRDADIGEIFVSAETGKVVKNELHIDRVD